MLVVILNYLLLPVFARTLAKEIFHLSVAFGVKQKFHNNIKKVNKWP